METCIWILLAAGVATTAARVAWAGPRAILSAAAAWAIIPWLASDRVASTSAPGLFAWASEPDRVGALAILAVAEATIGGFAAIRMAGRDGEHRRRGRLARWGLPLASLWPSPCLAVGLVGAQASLFHRASGWSFSTIDAGLSAATFAAIAGLGLAWRLARPELSSRAASAVPLSAILFAQGAAMPPLLDRRPRGTRPVELDARATVFLAVFAVAGVGLGVVVRLSRSRALRKGASST